MSRAPQSDVISVLADPATHGGADVQRIDTHASIVFLAGDRALKLKRAVTYDYLDFSTVERRRQFCEAELRISGRMAPALYRRVVPVVRTAAGALALGGEGEPVDWVVEMTRFDQDALFDRLAGDGCLDVSLMPALGAEIAAFHDGCAVRPDFGGSEGIRRVIEGNAAGFQAYGEGVVDRAGCDALTLAARTELHRCARLLDSRRAAGMVRQCHGDLHLGNIVLFDNRPTLFDAIEFNDDIACIDVMYDLAFLLMDLWHRGLPRHANALFNAYLSATQDIDALAALPLFLSCRAAIRAKTTATAVTLQADPDEAAALRVRARDYLELSQRVLQPSPPVIVAVGGLSGSGKSTLARALAPALGGAPGAVILRTDEIRKRLCGVPPLTRLGPFAYTPEMSARVYDALAGEATAIVEAGQSVIADAVFARGDDRAAFQRAATSTHARFAGVWLDAPEAVLIERVSHRESDASDADVAVVRMQCAQWSGQVPWCRVDATGDEGVVFEQAVQCLQAQEFSCTNISSFNPRRARRSCEAPPPSPMRSA